MFGWVGSSQTKCTVPSNVSLKGLGIVPNVSKVYRLPTPREEQESIELSEKLSRGLVYSDRYSLTCICQFAERLHGAECRLSV
jgi:hypothetical protein